MNPITQSNLRVLVFKTNISDPEEKNLTTAIDGLSQILRWNVDLDDCDLVLRIETIGLKPEMVESMLCRAGYQCKELED